VSSSLDRNRLHFFYFWRFCQKPKESILNTSCHADNKSKIFEHFLFCFHFSWHIFTSRLFENSITQHFVFDNIELSFFLHVPLVFLEEPSFDPCYPIRAVGGKTRWAACLQSSRPMIHYYVSITVSALQRPLNVVLETCFIELSYHMVG